MLHCSEYAKTSAMDFFFLRQYVAYQCKACILKALVARYWTRSVTDHMAVKSITKITKNIKSWEIIRVCSTDAAANYKSKLSPDRARNK